MVGLYFDILCRFVRKYSNVDLADVIPVWFPAYQFAGNISCVRWPLGEMQPATLFVSPQFLQKRKNEWHEN